MKFATKLLTLTSQQYIPPVVVAPFLDGTTPSMAYATDRLLLTSYEGSLYTDVSGVASTLFDQSGNAFDFVQSDNAQRPAIVSTHGKLALVGNGSQQMQGPLISAVYGNVDTWVFMVLEATALDVDGNTAAKGNVALGDTADGGNIVFSRDAYGNVRSVQFDGSYKQTPMEKYFPNNVAVVQFRRDATKLYCRVNMLPEREITCAAFTAIAYNLVLFGLVNNRFKGAVWAMAGYANANVPNLSKREEIVTKLMTAYSVPTPPLASAYPSAANTGTSGILTPYVGDVVYSNPGETITDLDITGAVTINADGVTLQNCRIRYGLYFGITINGANVNIINCEIDGSTSTVNQTGITVRDSNCTITGCNIHHIENGIEFAGNDHVFTGNYIHNFVSPTADGHFDGFEGNGGSVGGLIEHNTVILDSTQTGAVQLNNFAGDITNIVVNNNYLSGGGYPLYVTDAFSGGTITGVVISNNVVGIGAGGYFYYGSGITSSGNREATTGFRID